MFRNALWSIAKGILWFLDGFFDIINKIWRYKFFDNDYVNKIFGGALIVACSWLILKVVIELVMNYIVKNDGRGSPLTIYRGVILAIVMMFLINPLFQFGYDFSTKATNAVITVSGMDKSNGAEGTISKALIRATSYDDEMKQTDKEYLINNWKKIKINSTEGGFAGIGDCYKYSLNFIMLIILSVVTVFLLFFVAIQMAKRVMEIALMKIVGPFCCTSLTNNQSKAFETWTKSTMGYFLITIVQFICIGLLLNMFGSAIKDNGTLTGIFLIIGALLFALGLLVMGCGLIAIGIPPTPEEFWRIILFIITGIFYVAFWLNLSIFFSIRFKQAATSALACVAIWLFFSVFYNMIINLVGKALSPSAWASDYQVIAYQRFMLNLLRFAPSELFNEATMTLLMPSVRSLGPLTMEQVHGAIPSPLPLGQSLLVVWPQLTGLIAATVVCFALSYVSFMRKEVRSR